MKELYIILLAAVLIQGAIIIVNAKTAARAKRRTGIYLNRMEALYKEVKQRQKSTEMLMDAMEDKMADTMDAMDEVKNMLQAVVEEAGNEKEDDSTIQE